MSGKTLSVGDNLAGDLWGGLAAMDRKIALLSPASALLVFMIMKIGRAHV